MDGQRIRLPRVDDMRREAELAAAIGKALAVSGMDDATDAQYQAFARLLEQGGLAAADAARRQDQAAAQQAVSDVSRSCVDCHADYR